MPRHTPITDFLFRLEVDSNFAKSVLDDDAQLVEAALNDFGGLDDATRIVILNAIRSKDFSTLQTKVLDEHPDTDTVKILPRGWVA